MSGTDKIPPLGRFHADLRLISGRVHSNLQPHPPSISANVPAPHPFIAHFYPVVSGVDQFSSSLPHSDPSFAQLQQPSPSTLVALATSGCRAQNLSTQLLQSLQSKAQRLANGDDSKTTFASKAKPTASSHTQFDVESLTEKTLTTSTDFSGFAPFQSGFNPFPMQLALEKVMRNLRNNTFVGDATANHSAALLHSYFGGGQSILPHSPVSPERIGFARQDSGTPFSSQRLDSPVFTAPSKEKWCCDEQIAKKRRLSSGAAISSTNSPRHETREIKFSEQIIPPSSESVTNQHIGPKVPIHSSHANVNCDKNAGVSLDPSIRSSSASSAQSCEEMPKNTRKRSVIRDACPVCGITVRPPELQNHLRQELESLERLSSETRENSTARRRISAERRTSLQRELSSTSTATSSNKRLSNRDLSPRTNRINRAKTYRKIQCNRTDRMNARIGQRLQNFSTEACHTSLGGQEKDFCSSGAQGCVEFNGMTSPRCPVCSLRLSGTFVSLNDHIGECLRQKRNLSQHIEDEDEIIDVESGNDLQPPRSGSAAESNDEEKSNRSCGSEYEINSQSRLRANAILSTQTLSSSTGFQLIHASSSGGGQFLEVEPDGSQSFGPAQFTEEDLETYCTEFNGSKKHLTGVSNKVRERLEISETKQDDRNQAEPNSTGRLKEKRATRCMICMDSYTNPVTSIQCWHVHCRTCWLKVLSIKKLCPQCNAVTSLDKLRKIYL